MSKEEFVIPLPPAQIFERTQTASTDVLLEGQPIYFIEREDYSNGINIYYHEAKYPKKGFPTPDAIANMNVLKRNLRMILHFHPFNFLLLKRFKRVLNDFATIGQKMLQPVWNEGHIIPIRYTDQYLTPCSRELKKALHLVCFELHLDLELSVIAAHIIQYDDAYRYRFQDVLSETTSTLLRKNPRKEVLRLSKLFASREHNKGIQGRVLKIGKLLSILLLVPSAKKVFRKVIDYIDLSHLQLDEADTYWVCVGDYGYDFLGKTFEERKVPQPPSFKAVRRQ